MGFQAKKLDWVTKIKDLRQDLITKLCVAVFAMNSLARLNNHINRTELLCVCQECGRILIVNATDLPPAFLEKKTIKGPSVTLA